MATTGAAAGDGDRRAGLTAVVERQRLELEAQRARAAADAVVDLARGVLVERLSCSPADAGKYLASLSAQSGTPLVEVAADIVGHGADDVISGAPPEPPRHRLRLAEAAAQRACDGSDLAAAVLEESLAALGVDAVALWMAEPDGALGLVGEAGLAPLDASRWRHVPPQMDWVGNDVLRDGQSRWSPQGCPATDARAVVGRAGAARATLPLRGARGLAGVMEIYWPSPREDFDVPLRRHLLALADVSAQALATAALRTDDCRLDAARWLPALLDGIDAPALLTRAVRDAHGEVVDFRVEEVTGHFEDPAGRPVAEVVGRRLLHAYPLVGMPGGLFERAVEVLTTGQPYRGTGLVVGAAASGETDVRIARLWDGVAISFRTVVETDRLASLLAQAERLGRLGGWQQDLTTGEVHWTAQTFALFQVPQTVRPVPLEGLDAYVHPDDRAAAVQFRDSLLELGESAVAVFRLRVADAPVRQVRAWGEPIRNAVGSVVAIRGAYQDLSSHYRDRAALAATREQLADTQARAEDQQRLALRLQLAITPVSSHRVETSGLDIAVRYRPAEQGHLVGGDWYDVVVLPGGQMLLAVGDIAGHGITAVDGMVALRNSLRGLAVTGAGPAQLLAWLNRVACELVDDTTGTVVCGLFDPDTATLRWASGGHLPPVLVRRGGARTLAPPSGLMLGAVADAEYEEKSVRLGPGDRLLLYTDGLVERRETGVDEALTGLLEVARAPVDDIERYADHVLASTVSDTDDDTCLIALRVR